MPDILNQIDDVLANLSCCAFCKIALSDRGPSGDFCGEVCQWEWSARRLGVQSCIEMVPAFPGAVPTEPPVVLERPPVIPTQLGPIDPEVHEALRQEVRRQGLTTYDIDGVTYDVDQPVTCAEAWSSNPSTSPIAGIAAIYHRYPSTYAMPPRPRPFLTAALDSEADAFAEHVTAALDAALEPDTYEPWPPNGWVYSDSSEWPVDPRPTPWWRRRPWRWST